MTGSALDERTNDAIPGQLTVTSEIHFASGQRNRKRLRPGPKPPGKPCGRVPRIAKLMALAIRFDQLIRDGVVADYAELARLGNVSRARVTQIMNLLNLAPDIQESILFLPLVEHGKDPLTERNLRAIVARLDWRKQRQL